MTSFASDAAIREALAGTPAPHVETKVFSQFISLRMNPDGSLFKDDDGAVSPYAPGHGDLSGALQRSGLLESFKAGGGKYLIMSNVDNLGATLDPEVLGAHIDAGVDISAEVVRKLDGDVGGAPAWVDGKLQVVEAFRFPPDFDQDQIPVFSINTFLFTADVLERDFELDWFAVNKKVGDKPVVQFEHLVGQLTAFASSQFIQVSRDGDASRFEPVKTPGDLDARRGNIASLLKARGVYPV